MEEDFRTCCAHDQAMNDMATGTAIAVLLETLSDAEAER